VGKIIEMLFCKNCRQVKFCEERNIEMTDHFIGRIREMIEKYERDKSRLQNIIDKQDRDIRILKRKLEARDQNKFGGRKN